MQASLKSAGNIILLSYWELEVKILNTIVLNHVFFTPGMYRSSRFPSVSFEGKQEHDPSKVRSQILISSSVLKIPT